MERARSAVAVARNDCLLELFRLPVAAAGQAKISRRARDLARLLA